MADTDLNRTIDGIGLSPAAVADLTRAGIRYVGELIQRPDARVLAMCSASSVYVEIKGALAAMDLCLGMLLDSWAPGQQPVWPEVPPPELATDPTRILAGDPAAIDALAHGDEVTWQALAEHAVLHPGTVASPTFVSRLLERAPDLTTLLERAHAVLASTRSSIYSTSLTAARALLAWLGGGIAVTLEPIHPAALAVRYAREMNAPEGVDVARALVADVRRFAPPRPRLSDALVLLARRALEEDGAFEEALAAATEAEAIHGASGERPGVQACRRLRGAALLLGWRFDEAFAVLDSEMALRGPRFEGASRIGARRDPVLEAIDDAAAVALWAQSSTPEWVRALGGIAERTGRSDLWERFVAQLTRMVDGSKSPASDLEVVIRQAGERDLGRTVQAARDLAAARDLDPDAVRNPYFG